MTAREPRALNVKRPGHNPIVTSPTGAGGTRSAGKPCTYLHLLQLQAADVDGVIFQTRRHRPEARQHPSRQVISPCSHLSTSSTVHMQPDGGPPPAESLKERSL
ncbi:unnamed protein product [Pleuronectes platessa]|uniref:Uncharacterized protein n=1 Tax=Pleuronectes platessa TaxID=8262 RepID=A0A9N7VYH2_PLEPL|nr:unnamed protein product [Pleuronectes platessa]